MSGGLASRLREGLSKRRVLAIVVLVGVLVIGALILPRLPRPVAAIGTLDQCLGGWPVVAFEGEEWKDALPGDLRAYAPNSIPIASWPSGLRFDEASGVLLDASGEPLFHKGDRVRIKGSVVEVHGDPSPCYYTLGVRVEEIANP
jgi:hypothetical protein